jgi:hypothetical protein
VADGEGSALRFDSRSPGRELLKSFPSSREEILDLGSRGTAAEFVKQVSLSFLLG